MRLIDADALKLTFCKECTLYPDNCLEKNGGECDWGSIYHIKYCAPTIDAVPVVRCGECKHFEREDYYCNRLGVTCDHEWFCADGEKEQDHSPRFNCYGCNSYDPVKCYCMRYLRGVEKAVYMCPVSMAEMDGGADNG